jgi:hypothetical protein
MSLADASLTAVERRVLERLVELLRDEFGASLRSVWVVATARFDPQLEQAATATQRSREDAEDHAASVSPARAQEVVELANRFVSAVAAVLRD